MKIDFLALLLSSGFLLMTPKPLLGASAKGPQKEHLFELKVLSYGSMTGPGSLGEFIENEFPASCPATLKCRVQIEGKDELSGLLGRLRSQKRAGAFGDFDLVLGLNEHEYREALKEGLVNEGRAFNRSPFAIIVDTEKLPRKEWPKSWRELSSKLKAQLLIQDPRLSSSGVGWLRAIFEFKLITPQASKVLSKRVFPSWSSSYESFLKGEAPAVWSYLSSEAYHRCKGENKKEQTRYRALPLTEGYPVQVEWVAPIRNSTTKRFQKRFVDFVLSTKVQEKIPELNWMFPANLKAQLPKCWQNLSSIKTLDKAAPVKLQTWIDQWSL